MKPEFAMVQRRAAASVLALLVCCGCALAEWDDLGVRASCGTVQLTGAPDLLDFSFDPTANGLWVTTAGGDLRQHGLEVRILDAAPSTALPLRVLGAAPGRAGAAGNASHVGATTPLQGSAVPCAEPVLPPARPVFTAVFTALPRRARFWRPSQPAASWKLGSLEVSPRDEKLASTPRITLSHRFHPTSPPSIASVVSGP